MKTSAVITTLNEMDFRKKCSRLFNSGLLKTGNSFDIQEFLTGRSSQTLSATMRDMMNRGRQLDV